MTTSLDKLIKNLSKAAKGVHIDVLANSLNYEVISTPAYDLNRILSGSLFGGLRTTKMTLIVGPEHSFKSSFMMLCSAAAQKMGYTPVIIETEGAYDVEFAARWGVNVDNAIYAYAPLVSDVDILLNGLIEAEDDKFMICIDSIGGLFRRKVFDDMGGKEGTVRSAPTADQGSLAKDIKTMLKTLAYTLIHKNSIAICAGHYYGNPSGYGDAEQIGGGKYVKLAPHYIISLKKSPIYENQGESVSKRGRIIGQEIKAITLKNRVYKPFQEATIEINFEQGINKYAGLLELAIRAGLITQGGAGWYTNNLTADKVQGKENAEHWIKDTDMIKKIDEWLQSSGYSNINNSIKDIVETQDNLEERQLKEDDESNG